MWDSAEWRAVVFVSDQRGAALQRRERCLKRAGIGTSIVIERRPSGTYYKLCVREDDVVDAHLALQLGGFCRSQSLRRKSGTLADAVRELAQRAWDEGALFLHRLLDFVRDTPGLLALQRRD